MYVLVLCEAGRREQSTKLQSNISPVNHDANGGEKKNCEASVMQTNGIDEQKQQQR